MPRLSAIARAGELGAGVAATLLLFGLLTGCTKPAPSSGAPAAASGSAMGRFTRYPARCDAVHVCGAVLADENGDVTKTAAEGLAPWRILGDEGQVRWDPPIDDGLPVIRVDAGSFSFEDYDRLRRLACDHVLVLQNAE